VQKILSSAQLSGSLEYWGVCDVFKPRPEFPKLRPVSGHEGSAREVLQEVFADDTKMRVTQESDGKIRMVETDVPKDLLEVTIHHLSFPSNYSLPDLLILDDVVERSRKSSHARNGQVEVIDILNFKSMQDVEALFPGLTPAYTANPANCAGVGCCGIP
jgi:hypothetical protein